MYFKHRIAMTIAVSVLLMFAAHPAQAAAAEVYRWKDQDGKVHYGDAKQAPAGSEKMPLRESQGGKSSIPAKPESKPTQTAAADNASTDERRKISRAAYDECMLIARASVGADHPEAGMLSEKLQWNRELAEKCPGYRFECVTYRWFPKKNYCAWYKLKGNEANYRSLMMDHPKKMN